RPSSTSPYFQTKYLARGHKNKSRIDINLTPSEESAVASRRSACIFVCAIACNCSDSQIRLKKASHISRTVMAGIHVLAGILVALLLFAFGLLETFSIGLAIVGLCFAITGIAIVGWLGTVFRELTKSKSL
ncbi:MAG: hypothetical protein JRN15_21385, partial [Nitrososphaerota archaeon]|nr:hypothetical protein [Nitrososphaerota archaeon]